MLSIRQAKFLTQQRTQYLDVIGSNPDYKNPAVLSTLFDLYKKDMENLFRSIEPHLPETVNTMIDIGCGLGGIDVLLAERYPKAAVWLLDKNGDEGSKIGWHHSAEDFGCYNSLDETQNYLRENGVNNTLHLITEIPHNFKVDLAVSFLSWGFHYPLSTYQFSADTLIVDVRRGFEKNLPINHKVIYKGRKHDRVFVKNFLCS